MQDKVTYGLLGDNALGGGSVRAGGLLVLDRSSGAIPGRGRLLLGREPGGDFAEHDVLKVDERVGRSGVRG